MLYSNVPLSYLFCLVYLCLTLGSVFFSDSLLILWVFIELQIILFITISFPYFRSYHASLVLYFLIQSVSSLVILGFAFYNTSVLLLGFGLKLGLFPFFGWYLVSLTAFPSVPLFLGLTFQKLPSFIFLGLLFSNISGSVLFLLVLLSFLGGFASLPSVFSLRFLLVWSSLLGNIWFFLGVSQSLNYFFIYFLVYSGLVWIFFVVTSSSSITSGWVMLVLFGLGGFPPLPLFFVKVFVLYSVVISLSVPIVFLTLLSSVVIIYMYCSVSLSGFLTNYQKL